MELSLHLSFNDDFRTEKMWVFFVYRRRRKPNRKTEGVNVRNTFCHMLLLASKGMWTKIGVMGI